MKNNKFIRSLIVGFVIGIFFSIVLHLLIGVSIFYFPVLILGGVGGGIFSCITGVRTSQSAKSK